MLGLFCAPLFVGLNRSDFRSDEAIYAYAVDRMVETGDWLTPRSIPYDGPFLEKPPLKLWLVAAAIGARLLPSDEFGQRFLDAAFAAVAFVYVYWIGRRLAGWICGFVSVLALFTFHRLLFEHGLRDQTMEAALVLSFCGGVYHFARWVEDPPAGRTSRHAWASAAYLTLGFMTKFVAVLFLPLVCAVALAWRDNAWRRLRSSWRVWIGPLLVAAAAPVPWFVYQSLRHGSAFWQTIVGEHVYTRFTSSLDPRHLQPWYFYYAETWSELVLAGSEWLAAAGMAMLAVHAWKERPWLARFVFLWWLLPVVLISAGTSKAFHYAYPFLPPVALGIGAVVQGVLHLLERGLASGVRAGVVAVQQGARRLVSTRVAAMVRGMSSAQNGWPSRRWRLLRGLLVASATAALAISVWTAMAGPVRWELHGIRVLSNTTVVRPIFTAAVLFGLSGSIVSMSRLLAIGIVALIALVPAYSSTIARLAVVDHPLRTIRDCAVAATPSPTTHVYPSYDELRDHSFFYYLRGAGPWIEHNDSPKLDELQLRLYAPGQHSLVILSAADYGNLIAQQASGDAKAGGMPPGLSLSPDVVLLTPGPFERCTAAAVAAGGRRLGDG